MERSILNKSLAILMVAGVAGAAVGQTNFYAAADRGSVFINEVLTNVKGYDDDEGEYIELAGPPCGSLDGYALIVINSSAEGNDFDEDGTAYFYTEVDEAFLFSSKHTFSEDGFFVLWNSSRTPAVNPSNSSVSSAMGSSDVFSYFRADSAVNSDLLQGIGANLTLAGASIRHEAWFSEVALDAADVAGSLNNDGSQTFLLIDMNDVSSTVTISEIQKDARPLGPVGTPSSSNPSTDADIAWTVAVIDSVAFSNQNGGEYTFNEGEEIDFTPGFTPDALSRVDDITNASTTGYDAEGVSTIHTIGLSCPSAEEFRDAYTNWVWGDTANADGLPGVGGTQFGQSYSGSAMGDYASPTGGTPICLDININDRNGYLMTPGFANGSSAITVGSSQCGEGRGDLDGDGQVTWRDLQKALHSSDPEAVRNVLNNIGR